MKASNERTELISREELRRKFRDAVRRVRDFAADELTELDGLVADGLEDNHEGPKRSG